LFWGPKCFFFSWAKVSQTRVKDKIRSSYYHVLCSPGNPMVWARIRALKTLKRLPNRLDACAFCVSEEAFQMPHSVRSPNPLGNLNPQFNQGCQSNTSLWGQPIVITPPLKCSSIPWGKNPFKTPPFPLSPQFSWPFRPQPVQSNPSNNVKALNGLKNYWPPNSFQINVGPLRTGINFQRTCAQNPNLPNFAHHQIQTFS